MDSPSSAQYNLFKDCLASRLFNDPEFREGPGEGGASGAEELDDFVSYLASEAWPSIPLPYQQATFDTRDSLNLNSVRFDSDDDESSTTPTIDRNNTAKLTLKTLSPAFTDTLTSYGLSSPSDPSSASTFLRSVISTYLTHATSPPPVWSSTRRLECEICEREVPLTYHHLIPKSVQSKALKRGWHEANVINKVAWLCRPCHSVVHRVVGNEELARSYHSVDLLLEREDVRRWRAYAAKQRWGVKRV